MIYHTLCIYNLYIHHELYEGASLNHVIHVAGHAMRNNIKIIHEDQKDYKCEICGKFFSEAEKVKKHIYAVHEGHKDYKCESCGKLLSKKQSLKAHTQLFHGANVQNSILKTCNWVLENGEVCGKSFAKSYNLAVHMQMHQDIRPFGCSFCDKTFR